jgi:Tol biopolymer transport system component
LVVGWVAAAGAGVLALMYAKRLTTATQLVHGKIDRPPGYEFSDVFLGAPAVSPDGQLVAFSAVQQSAPTRINEAMIFIRRTETGVSEPLAGTRSALFPFWSPDGQYLGFFAEGKLKKVHAGGGPVQTLCDAPDGRGGSWSPRGVIVFAPRISGPLQAVSDGGGTPTEVTPARKDDDQFTNRNPAFLPDGKHFLYVQRSGKDTAGSVYAGSLDGGTPRQILPVGSNVAYSDGYLFYAQEGTLTAQQFDAAQLRFEGKPIPIAANVNYYNPRDVAFFGVSQRVLVYRKAPVQDRQPAWFDVAGKESVHWGDPAPYGGGTFSAGSRMSVLYRDNPNGRGNSLWLMDIQRKTVIRLTPDAELTQSGVVTADGNAVLISTTSGYDSSLVRRWLNGSGKEEKLLDEPKGYLTVLSISRDGRYTFFADQSAQTGFDIFYVDLEGDRKLVPVLNGPYNEFDARLSPDGKWLAYSSDETGTVELYVTPFPGAGAKWQVSNGGILIRDTNTVMDWSPDGKRLMYQQGNKIYEVEVHGESGKPDFSIPKEMTTLPDGLVVISILPDGKGILAMEPVGERASVPLDFVLNWQHLVQ